MSREVKPAYYIRFIVLLYNGDGGFVNCGTRSGLRRVIPPITADGKKTSTLLFIFLLLRSSMCDK